MKAIRNGRENPLTITVTVFFCRERERERNVGRENEIDITGDRERNISIGNVSISTGNRYFKSGMQTHVTPSNI
jgi:hypothetical protein